MKIPRLPLSPLSPLPHLSISPYLPLSASSSSFSPFHHCMTKISRIEDEFFKVKVILWVNIQICCLSMVGGREEKGRWRRWGGGGRRGERGREGRGEEGKETEQWRRKWMWRKVYNVGGKKWLAGTMTQKHTHQETRRTKSMIERWRIRKNTKMKTQISGQCGVYCPIKLRLKVNCVKGGARARIKTPTRKLRFIQTKSFHTPP